MPELFQENQVTPFCVFCYLCCLSIMYWFYNNVSCTCHTFIYALHPWWRPNIVWHTKL